jgi:hypothetical protein
MKPEQLKHSTLSTCLWSITICIRDDCLEILITLVFPTFISNQQHLPISISLSIMPCSTVSSLASSTRSSAYFTVRILLFLFWSLQTLQEFPCVTLLPNFTRLVSPWSRRTLTLWFMHSLLRRFLSRQSDKCTIFCLNSYLLFLVSIVLFGLQVLFFCTRMLHVNYCSVCNWSLGGWVST